MPSPAFDAIKLGETRGHIINARKGTPWDGLWTVVGKRSVDVEGGTKEKITVESVARLITRTPGSAEHPAVDTMRPDQPRERAENIPLEWFHEGEPKEEPKPQAQAAPVKHEPHATAEHRPTHESHARAK
jgi:hypothetical protein